MADALSTAGVGHNLSRASFLEFCLKADEVQRELQDAQESVRSLRKRRKDLRKDMGAAGVDVDMYDRMVDDLERTDDERRAREFEYTRYLQWMSRPAGFQASIDLATDDEGERALNEYELHAIDAEGHDAGQTGRRHDSNPYRPGTEAHQRWAAGWQQGQAAAVAKMGNGAAEPKRPRRGRPKGSKNAPKVVRVEDLPEPEPAAAED